MNEEEKVAEMYKNVLLAQEQIKGYKFNCIGKLPGDKCLFCKEQLVTFVTTGLREAEKHSRENSMPMWISKDE